MKLGKERLVVYLLCPLLLGALLVIATLGGYLISREAGTMCLIVMCFSESKRQNWIA